MQHKIYKQLILTTMYSKETETVSRKDTADQKDIRAGFALLSILRDILDRATSANSNLQNEHTFGLSSDIHKGRSLIRHYAPGASPSGNERSRSSPTDETERRYNELLSTFSSYIEHPARSQCHSPFGRIPSVSSLNYPNLDFADTDEGFNFFDNDDEDFDALEKHSIPFPTHTNRTVLSALSSGSGNESIHHDSSKTEEHMVPQLYMGRTSSSALKWHSVTSKDRIQYTSRVRQRHPLPPICSTWGMKKSSLSGDGTMTASSSFSRMVQVMQGYLNSVKDVLSTMEEKVAGPIYCYLPIYGWQDNALFLMAMDIERNLDMLEYKQVQKNQNDAMIIIGGLIPMLHSILTVLNKALGQLPVNMISERSIRIADDNTKLSSMPNLENITNKPASPSAEKQIPSRVKETMEIEILEKGQDGIYLVPFLLSSESDDLVISIQDVYKNSRVKEHFDVRIWVNISSRSTTIRSEVSVPGCINELMNAHVMNACNHLPPVHSKEFEIWMKQIGIAGDNPEAHDQNMKDLEEVIRCRLVQRKFLLVLHGISEDQMGQLEQLFRVLKCGRKGSKIILLTTSTHVEESVRNINITQSDEIENNVSWHFFRSYAFDNLNIEGYQVELGIKITTLLKPFPIAMKMIGCMLKHEPLKIFWERVYQNIHRIVIDGKGDDHKQLISLLKLCYDQLPARVGLCFNYCSLYPQGWRFTAQSLIHIWISDGITEDTGTNYFSCLYSRGFFELLKLHGEPSTSCYVMHSAIHLLAEVVSAKTFLRVESNYLPSNPQLLTHMSIMGGFLPTLRKFRQQTTEMHLRTLIVFGPTEARPKEILDEFLKGQKYIRALDLTGCIMQKLPKLTMESRHHLRYLSLQDTSIETLEKFDHFYHLMVLNVQGCQLSSLPASKKLLRVRHIIGSASLVSSIHCIGKLKNLQELQEFRVRNRPGYGIEELQHMNLRKSLSITNLENVTRATKAGEVNLSLKTCLVSLKLEWHSTEETSQSMSAEVLERLQPPKFLNELEINGYPGIKFPTWFTEDHLINVKKVMLRNCSFVTVFAPLAKLPSLEVLTLESFSVLKRMSEPEESDRTQYFKHILLKFPTETSCRFPRLVKLRIEDMPVLEEWTEQQPCFPCLEELTVRNCPKLPVLPPLCHARVKRMHIEGVQLISFGSPRVGSIVPFGAFLHRALQPSKMLILRHCPNLSTFTIAADNSSSSHRIGPLLQLEITGMECIPFFSF